MHDLIQKLDHWQTLVGAALGPFLAIILSGIGFWIGTKYKAWQDKKEAIRLVEVSMTRGINNMFSTRKKLENFIERLRQLAADARATTGDTTYFLERINYPAMPEIFVNENLAGFKFGSTYLHNQVMFANSGIKELNSWIIKMEKDFDSMTSKNEFLMILTPRPAAHDQRNGYAENLDLFAQAVSDFVTHIMGGVQIASQIKVYNLRLMKKRIMTVMKHEGTTFKYFKTSDDLNKYKEWSSIIKRVNTAIESDVKKFLADAEEGFRAMRG